MAAITTRRNSIARMARSYKTVRYSPMATQQMLGQSRFMSLGQSRLRRHRHSLPFHIYHLTAATVGRAPIFAGPAAFAASRTFHEVPASCDIRLVAWVLMPDHAHWLVQLGSSTRLDDVMTRLKSGSARKANEARGVRGHVWGRGYYEHCIRNQSDLRDAARYICANPVRAGIVTSLGQYPFWDTMYL